MEKSHYLLLIAIIFFNVIEKFVVLTNNHPFYQSNLTGYYR